MKFFHLSDLHIGIRLHNRDLREDQEYILARIIDLAGERGPDAVVIAGDIYDKAVPSAEAVSVFDGFISGLRKAVPEAVIMMISGNHDSAMRLNCYRSVLSGQDIYMIGLPPQKPDEHIEKVTLRDEYGNVNFYLLPFVRPSMVRQVVGDGVNAGPKKREGETTTDPAGQADAADQGRSLSYNEALHRLIGRERIDTSERNVLVSHQFYLPKGCDPGDVERSESEVRTVGNIDQVGSDVLSCFDYAALGHIHKAMSVGNGVLRYCGTPLGYSLSEAGQEKGFIEVELKGKGNICSTRITLEPLRRVRTIKGTLEEVLKQGSVDYVGIVLTDRHDLEICDMQDRLRRAFPNLLEIRRENARSADYRGAGTRTGGGREPDPYELCCSFLGDLDEEEREILKDVVRKVQETADGIRP